MSINPFDRQAPIAGVKRILVVGSGKGGVGKSTVAANLALALKSLDRKVGLLDADIYGPSLPRMFGAINQPLSVGADGKMEPIVRHGLKIMSMGFLVNENQAVVWRGPMLFKAFEQFFRDVNWGELDDLIIDLPPGTGDVALTIAQKVPVAGAIVVCTPQNLALVDAKKAIDMFDQIHFQPVGTTDVSSRVALFPKGELDSYLDAKRIVKMAELPFDPKVGLATEAGMPVVVSDSTGAMAELYKTVAAKLV
jgi:ATP-binding protein involved in chromosome partitioning